MLYGSPYGRYGEAAFGGSTSPEDGGSAVGGPSDDVIALRHLRAGGGGCVGRLIARWSSFMHVSVGDSLKRKWEGDSEESGVLAGWLVAGKVVMRSGDR